MNFVRLASCLMDKQTKKKVKNNIAIGAMITASHNPEPDNGLKMIDPDGGMMSPIWEAYAAKLANAEEDQVTAVLASIAAEAKVDWDIEPVVFVGVDTRDSSEPLCNTFMQASQLLGARVTNYGLVSTPQLHYMVGHHNKTGSAALEDYVAAMMNFATAVGDAKIDTTIVDCGFGVGAIAIEALAGKLKSVLPLDIINRPGEGKLNTGAGAEHVQKQRVLPSNIDSAKHRNCKIASLDGDADRIVYFFNDDNGAMQLLDGDKITSLVAGYMKELLDAAGLSEDLSFGAIQTAYANGASTKYISETVGVTVECTPTGVKHLHHKALDFDMGIYFEANGHGTVIFSDKALEAFKKTAESGATDETKQGMLHMFCVLCSVFCIVFQL
jgi:phosphoacetylglucosamine mutase